MSGCRRKLATTHRLSMKSCCRCSNSRADFLHNVLGIVTVELVLLFGIMEYRESNRYKATNSAFACFVQMSQEYMGKDYLGFITIMEQNLFIELHKNVALKHFH